MTTASSQYRVHNAAHSQADLATLHLNDEGIIEDCSAVCESVFGYSKQELLNGHHVSMLLPKFEKIELVRNGQINPRLRFLSRCAIPFLAKRRDGTKFASEVFLNQLKSGSGAERVQIIVRNLGIAET